MMPTWWVSCAALVLVAVFVPLLAVAVALPYVDDVHLWVDWYPPLFADSPLLLIRLLCEFVYPFHLVCYPVSAHSPSCVDSCYVDLLVDLCVVLSPQTFRLLHSLGSTLALWCQLVHSVVDSCTQ